MYIGSIIRLWPGMIDCLSVCFTSHQQLRSYEDGLESDWASHVSIWDPAYKATHSWGGGTYSFVPLK